MEIEKQVKRFVVLERTKDDVAIAFFFTDGTEQILVIKNSAIEQMKKQIKL